MNAHSLPIRVAASALSFGLLILGTQQAIATQLNISQKPLVLSDSVAPNVILTLDDSGSMSLAVVPDAMGNNDAERQSRRLKSAHYNPMYYDPSITYRLPFKLNNDGTLANPGYNTTFTSAYHNGFVTARGAIDLSNNYIAFTSYNLAGGRGNTFGHTSTNTRLAENPPIDFLYNANLVSNNSSRTFTVVPGASLTIRRTSNSNCTASVTGIKVSDTITCTRISANNYQVDLTKIGIQAYYYRFDQTLSGCPAANPRNDDRCYALTLVSATSGQTRSDDTSAGSDERQNFAIWYSFYRNRALATLTAANVSFHGLPNSIRLTWQALNRCTTLNSAENATTCSGSSNPFREFSNQHRGRFFNWLPNITFGDATPLKAALQRTGNFIQASNTPVWDRIPGSQASPKYACRPNYHIMMTDGQWNEDTVIPRAATNADNSTLTLGDGATEYSPRAPFADSTQNTVADLAFYYWATDLAPNLNNELKPTPADATTSAKYWDPINNPATWQHLVNFNIGLGLGDALTNPSVPWTGETYGGAGYEAIKNGTVNWPSASRSNRPENVYDLWHAAVNSRGEFFSADDPNAMVEAFQQIINRIGNFTTSASRPAVAASQVSGSDGSSGVTREVYETKFSSDDWSGDLQRFDINALGERTETWSAKALLTSARTVQMADADGTGMRDFTWANLSNTQRALFNINPDSTTQATDNRGEARVNYIRGNRAGEGDSEGSFRRRSSALGDIVNSSPALVGKAQYLAYLADSIDGEAGEYSDFQAAAAERTPTIYVGANDGMLHGFNAQTGAETFAFIPSAVMPNLYHLTGQSYESAGHRYYVDGTPVVTDVYMSGEWRTVLIGSLRGGGRALFALDVTDPENVSLLWEFTHADMGHTFAQPVVARLHNGSWAVVTGNGYGNQTGAIPDKAALFVLDVETGEQLTPDEEPLIVEGDTARANGLSSVRLADNNSDGIADYAYAGDLQGNLWRFDLFSGNSFDRNDATFRVSTSYNGSPLFTALDADDNPQPIMAPPSLVRHPTQLGYLVMFGTGKYFEDSDGNVDTTKAHSLYAIWDRQTRAETTGSPPSITRRDLLEQTIESQSNGVFGGSSDIRLISENRPTWYSDNGQVDDWGWYLDLQVGDTRAGEMMINPMSARGDTLIFSTLTPNDDPCKDGVEAWLYAVNPASGARSAFTVFDMDGDGNVDASDNLSGSVVSGRKLSSAGGFTLNGDLVFSSGESMKVNLGPNSNGRQTWHFLPEDEE